MRKVSLFVVLLLSAGWAASPAHAAYTTADEILSDLNIHGAVYGDSSGLTIRFHGDDVATKTLQHTDGTVYGKGYTSGLGTSGDESGWQNHWEVAFPVGKLSDGTGLSNGGTVHGIAQCTRVGGTFAVPNYDMIDPYTTVTEDGERQCWCKMTHVREGTGTTGITPENPGTPVASSSWVFSYAYSSAAICAYYCAYYCALYVRYYASFRSAVFGLGALGHAAPADMCGQNLANGKLYDYQVPRVAKLSAGTYTASISAADGGKWMLRLRGVADNAVVTGNALTAALASSDLALDDSDGISARDGWVLGNDAAAIKLTFTIRSGEYIVEIAKVDATGAQNLMLEHGDTANTYVAPTPCIRVGSTKLVESAFEHADAVRRAIIGVVDHVVTNTIAQASAIGALQSGKQTRPADDPTDANNTENCPAGKQCLLVEGTDGVPHWYEIFDPIHRWMDGWIAAGKPAVKGEQSGSNWTYYNAFYRGDKAWRQTYIDGSTSTYDRPIDHATRCTSPSYNTETPNASPCYSEVGMFKTLGNGEWAEVYTTGDGTNAPVGVVYGTSKCTSVAGPNNYSTANPTRLESMSAADQEKWAELPAPYGQTDREGYERSKFTQCWCKTTAIGVPGDDGDPATGAVYPVNVASSSWVFGDARSSAAGCAYNCAHYCAANVRNYASFRSAVFGLAD